MPEPPPATPGFKCKLPTADEGFLQVPLPFDGSRLSTPTAAPCAASSRLPRKLQKYKFTGTRPLPRPPREGSGPAHRAGSAGTRYGPQPEYLELAQREGPLAVATARALALAPTLICICFCTGTRAVRSFRVRANALHLRSPRLRVRSRAGSASCHQLNVNVVWWSGATARDPPFPPLLAQEPSRQAAGRCFFAGLSPLLLRSLGASLT